MSSAIKDREEKLPFFKNVLNRRVPQIMGIYIAASWGIIQFVDWLVGRYLLSPYLIDLAFVILLTLIPSSLLVAYFHGRPGRDRWRRIETIGIPLNVVFTIVLVLLLFGGKDLGAVSQKVTLEDETGKKIERVVPKGNHRKKVALFYFENQTGDSSLDWLRCGLTYMLETDLSQDLFVEVLSPSAQGIENLDFYVYEKMKRVGYADGIGLPLALKRKIADETHMDYFLCGTLSRQGDEFILEGSLYRAKNARLAARIVVRSSELFQAIDRLTVRLKEKLELPARHIEEVGDLPVAEIFTRSLPAARLYTLGVNAMVFFRDWTKSRDYFEEALREDPSFAMVYYQLAAVYIFTGQNQKGSKAIETLMTHRHKLPERMQLYLKIIYYVQVKQDWDKGMAVLRMIIKLYPDDLPALSLKVIFLRVNNQPDEIIATYKRMLEIDPLRHEIFKKIAAVYEEKREFDQALAYYQEYARHFPQDPESFELIGRLHKQMGNIREAGENYRQALLLEPENVFVLIVLADLELHAGRFDEALEQYDEALLLAKTAKERSEVFKSLANFYRQRGQMKKSLEYTQLMIEALEEDSVPILVFINKIAAADDYVRAGQAEEAFRRLEALRPQLSPPLDRYLHLGYLLAYIEMRKPDEAEKHLSGFRELAASQANESLNVRVQRSTAEIHEMRGQYQDALKVYKKLLTLVPPDSSGNVLRRIGRCYRNLEQYDKAEESLIEGLKAIPFDGKIHLELALAYLGKGTKEKARTHLQAALDVWKEADPDYEPALTAKEKLRDLAAPVTPPGLAPKSP